MRDVLTALAATVAIALIALMVGPHFIDWNAQRLRVATAIEDRTGVPVRIAGPLRISFLPTPELDAEEIEFGPADAPLARAGRLTFSLSPLALLKGHLNFSSARADRVLVSRNAMQARLGAGNPAPDSDRLAQIGFEQLDLRGLRVVEQITSEIAPANGPGAFDITLEAPNLNGPFRLEVHDPAAGRDFRAQIGRLENGRARLKGTLEDKGLAGRVSLDGWFGLPGVAGRPIFDGAANFNGNPTLAGRDIVGKDGFQLPYQGTARLILNTDQAIADPVNLSVGTGETAFQLAGQAFLDLRSVRPRLQMKLGAKRYDATAHFAGDDPQRKGGELRAFLGLLGGTPLAMPLDIAAELAVDAVQVPGALLHDVGVIAALRGGGVVLESLTAGLPGGTRMVFARSAMPEALTLDGRIEIEARELQTLVGWIRGTGSAVNLPASARLTARLLGDGRGIRIPEIRIESAAGMLGGSGELLPAEAGKRALPKLSLDLAAERFDARVLAALDPLRPVPGVELATKLAVARLALDGQEMGGLQVALERDGATATLRQLRLSGRKGEAVTLSGTASGDGLQMTAKLDAERLGDIAQLAGALLPGAITEGFIRRSAQLEPAIAIANLRATTKSGDITWDILVDGKLGGTTITGRSQSSLKGTELAVNLQAELANPDGGRLAAQVSGFPTPPSAVPGRLAIKAEGNPRRAVTGTMTGSLAGVEMTFEGGLNPFRTTPFEGRFTLGAKDLALLGKALGDGAPTLREGLTGRVAGRILADRSKITLTGLDAAFGDDPMSGEVSFDLMRGGQIAGQIRMGALAFPPLLAPIFGKIWPQGASGWSGEAFSPPVPPLASGDLWIEAKRAEIAEGISLEQPQFVLRFSPGVLAFENFEGKLGDARIAGSVSMARKVGRVELGGRLAFARMPVAVLGGRASGEIPFTAGGGSPQELIGALSGAGRISLDDLVVPAADPQALARIVALPLDDLAPINENRVGGLIDQELRKGELRLSGLTAPMGLVNGLLRVSVAPEVGGRSPGATVGVTPVFTVDFNRREAEARFVFSQAMLPKDWSGAVPEITLALGMRFDGRGPRENVLQRRLQVASLVNGFLAMAIQRDLERAEAFEADVREREQQLRRQRGDAYLERRTREIREIEVAIEMEAQALQRRAEREKAERDKAEREAAALTAKIKALEEQPTPPVTPPLDLVPAAPAPLVTPAPLPAFPPG